MSSAEVELQRLIDQSRFYGELTEEVLRRAGISARMRVLDVGCGAGDVSLLVASLVGPSGSVIGIDRMPESAQLARARVASSQLADTPRAYPNGYAPRGGLNEYQGHEADQGRLVPDRGAVVDGNRLRTSRPLAAYARCLGVSIITESDGGFFYEAQDFENTDICNCRVVQHRC
jgi:SAM-dependent methyltransferase